MTGWLIRGVSLSRDLKTMSLSPISGSCSRSMGNMDNDGSTFNTGWNQVPLMDHPLISGLKKGISHNWSLSGEWCWTKVFFERHLASRAQKRSLQRLNHKLYGCFHPFVELKVLWAMSLVSYVLFKVHAPVSVSFTALLKNPYILCVVSCLYNMK